MNGLEKEFPEVLTCEIKDATSPESKKEIAEFGFGTHGMVFYDEAGNVVRKLDGHLMQEPTIRAALQAVMRRQ